MSESLGTYLESLRSDAWRTLQCYPPHRSLVSYPKPLAAAKNAMAAHQLYAQACFAISKDVESFNRHFRLAGEQLMLATQPHLLGAEGRPRRGTLYWDDAILLPLMFDDDGTREAIQLLQPLDWAEDNKESDPWSTSCFRAVTATILEARDAREVTIEFVGINKNERRTWVGHAEAMRAIATRDWKAFPESLALLCKGHRSICAAGMYRNQPIHNCFSLFGVAITRLAVRRGFEYSRPELLIPAELVRG